MNENIKIGLDSMNTILIFFALIVVIIIDILMVKMLKKILVAINQNEVKLKENLIWLKIHRASKMD